MLKHEDALICDLAETYHIYDYKRLPASLVASFAAGLRDTSRCKMILHGQKVAPEMLMLAGILDRVSLLLWTKTKDAESGKNRPRSIAEELLGTPKEEGVSFATGKDFEEARQHILAELAERGCNGN